MKKPETMTARVQHYIDHRLSLGFQMKAGCYLLHNFAQYADSSGHRGPLTTELAVTWAKLPTDGAPVYWARRLDQIRRFARYQIMYEPTTEVPPSGFLGSTKMRMKPHIYTDEEFATLIGGANKLTLAGGLRPRTYVTLFSLLACTGLRIAEALKLTRDDVDLIQGVLTVRETKFHKSRLVPLHRSATEALREYVRFRDGRYPAPQSKAFFLTDNGTALTYRAVEGTFQRLRRRLGWGNKAPRIYDLRHSFICRRLLTWYKENADVHHAIYALSTYVGHVKVTHTYWYVTGIPELLAVVSQRFEQFANQERSTTR